MTRILAAAIALSLAVASPVSAETAIPAPAAATVSPKPVVNPSPLAVNEAAAKRLQVETDARAKAWDAKLRKAMTGICKGC